MKKFILDIIMTTIIVILMKLTLTGVQIHELLGLFVYVLFILHKIFNFSWIKTVTKKFTSKATPALVKIMYILDAVLLINVTFIIISGIMISQFVFNGLNSSHLIGWSNWHHFSSYVALILISVHIGFHWKSIMFMVKKLLGIPGENVARRWLARAISVFIIIMGIKTLTKPEIYNNFTAPFKNDNDTETIAPDDTQQTIPDSFNNSGTTIQQTSVTLVADQTPTLDEYLSKLVCNGCGKRCPLTALRCGRGTQYKNSAVSEYNQKYSANGSTQTPDTNEDTTTDMPNQGGSDNQNGNQKPSFPNKQRPDSPYQGGQSNPSQNSSSSETSPLDFLFIMGMFVAGTHYILYIPKIKK